MTAVDLCLNINDHNHSFDPQTPKSHFLLRSQFPISPPSPKSGKKDCVLFYLIIIKFKKIIKNNGYK